MAHTPGEWIMANSGGTIICHDGVNYKRICLLEDRPLMITETVTANAKLIASAPDLLDACEQALKELNYLHNGQNSDAIEALRTAIDKATGGL